VTTDERPVRLVIADDEATVRAGLRMLISAEPDLEVVGEASDGLDAVETARRTSADVVLLDIRMPRLDGLEAARRLLDCEDPPRILMLTTFDDDKNIYEALRLGTSGFLLKVAPPEQLLDAVRLVATGQAMLDPAVTSRVIDAFGHHPAPSEAPPAELNELTPRELDVLKRLARGLTNGEIADELVLSAATVKTHVNRILMKLDLRDRTQAVVYAYESGLVAPGRH